MTTDKLTDAEQFFYEHAGWSYMPGKETPEQGRARGARRLAVAEQWAQRACVTVTWESDPDGTVTDAAAEAEGAVLRSRDGTVLASLWGIDGATPEYRRVVNAELAEEAMGAQLSSGNVTMAADEIIARIRELRDEAREFASTGDAWQRYGWASRERGFTELLQSIPGTDEEREVAERARAEGVDY